MIQVFSDSDTQEVFPAQEYTPGHSAISPALPILSPTSLQPSIFRSIRITDCMHIKMKLWLTELLKSARALTLVLFLFLPPMVVRLASLIRLY